MKILTVAAFLEAMKQGPYAWPGGYPLYFITSDGAALSFKTAMAEKDLIVDSIESKSTDGWRVVAIEVNWEDPDLLCEHSGERIESAYAEDEQDRPGRRLSKNPATPYPESVTDPISLREVKDAIAAHNGGREDAVYNENYNKAHRLGSHRARAFVRSASEFKHGHVGDDGLVHSSDEDHAKNPKASHGRYMVSKTFQVVTHESAKRGDYAEDGYEFEDTEMNLSQVLDAVNDLGYFEGLKDHERHQTLYGVDAEVDLDSGDETTYALHVSGSTYAMKNFVAALKNMMREKNPCACSGKLDQRFKR